MDGSKNENTHLKDFFEEFDKVKEAFEAGKDIEATIKFDKMEIRSTFKLEKLQIGPKGAFVIKFDAPELNEDMDEFN